MLGDTGKHHQKQLEFIVHLIFEFGFAHCDFRNLLLLPDFFYDPLYHIQLRELANYTSHLSAARNEASTPLHSCVLAENLTASPSPAAFWEALQS